MRSRLLEVLRETINSYCCHLSTSGAGYGRPTNEIFIIGDRRLRVIIMVIRASKMSEIAIVHVCAADCARKSPPHSRTVKNETRSSTAETELRKCPPDDGFTDFGSPKRYRRLFKSIRFPTASAHNCRDQPASLPGGASSYTH